METEKQDRVAFLEAEFIRLKFPTGRHGDTRDRAEIIATKPGTLRAWLSGNRPIPNYPFMILKLFGMLTSDQREEVRLWVRECAQRGDYTPQEID